MKSKGVILGIIFFLFFLVKALAPAQQTANNTLDSRTTNDRDRLGKFEIQLSYGLWTLGPFTPMVEIEINRIVEKMIRLRLGIGYLFINNQSDVDISSSSEQFFVASLWYHFHRRFSAGLRINQYDIHLLYTFYAQQSVSLPFNLLEDTGAVSEGSGYIDIRSFIMSILGRWCFLSWKRGELSLMGGVTFLPLRGKFHIDRKTIITFPLGLTEELEDHRTLTFAEMREQPDPEYPYKPQSLLVTPTLGLSLQYRLSKKFGFLVDVTLSEGTFMTLGLFFVF